MMCRALTIARSEMANADDKLRARRSNQCCFVIGDVRGDWDYCTAPRAKRMKAGRPVDYCDEHYQRMFVPAPTAKLKYSEKMDEAA